MVEQEESMGSRRKRKEHGVRSSIIAYGHHRLLLAAAFFRTVRLARTIRPTVMKCTPKCSAICAYCIPPFRAPPRSPGCDRPAPSRSQLVAALARAVALRDFDVHQRRILLPAV